MWKLKIEKIENGYILSHEEETDKNKLNIVKEVIEEADDERETMARLLYQVAAYFGHRYDKFAKDNLEIAWNKKGHKSE